LDPGSSQIRTGLGYNQEADDQSHVIGRQRSPPLAAQPQDMPSEKKLPTFNGAKSFSERLSQSNLQQPANRFQPSGETNRFSGT